MMAIAEVILNVQVCGQMILRVAAAHIADSEIRGSGAAGVEPRRREELREKLRSRMVRFVAGEFDALVGRFLESLRGKMAANAVASSRYRVAGKPDDYITGSFIIALGPIKQKTIITDVTERGDGSSFPKLLLIIKTKPPKRRQIENDRTNSPKIKPNTGAQLQPTYYPFALSDFDSCPVEIVCATQGVN